MEWWVTQRCGLMGPSAVAMAASEWNSLSLDHQLEVLPGTFSPIDEAFSERCLELTCGLLLPDLTVLAGAKPQDKLSLVNALITAGYAP